MQPTKKSLVIVCAQFYPVKHIAAFRMNALVKYWDHQNFDISVYCYGDEEIQIEYEGAKVFVLSGSAWIKLRQQQPGMPTWKHKLYSLNNRIIRYFSKNDYPGWSKNVLRSIKQNQAKIDVLFTSFSPVDAHIVGLELKRHFTSCYWIADMRDEMSMNQMLNEGDRLYYRKIEGEIGLSADLVTAVSKPILDGFQAIFKSTTCQFLEIRNGFDHDFHPVKVQNEWFTFVYAGTFYGKRKPDVFFKALSELKNNNELPNHWKIQFIGTHRNFSISQEFLPHVEFIPQISNEEVVGYLSVSDCQLLIHPPSAAKGIFTGKIFDYLSVERPILGIVDPNDVASELIKSCEAGFIADFNSVQEISTGIRKCIQVWKGEESLSYNHAEIQSLHRKHQVQKLVTFVRGNL
jgi:glycosyltransferase involved in cell wall biosynthesis